jgi:thioesterase domain-containing protein
VPRGPYHLAGLCFGGLVAFEVAQQLIARGREVHSVTLLDAALPRAEHYSLAVRGRELARELTHKPLRSWSNFGRLVWRKPASDATPSDAPPADAVKEARTRDPELDVDGPVAQRMVRDYQQRVSRIEVPLLVVRARERNQPAWRHMDPDMGWLGLSPQISIAPAPGSHLEILKEPYVAATVAAVRLVLATPLMKAERSTAPAERPSCAPTLPLAAVSAARSRTAAGARARRR